MVELRIVKTDSYGSQILSYPATEVYQDPDSGEIAVVIHKKENFAELVDFDAPIRDNGREVKGYAVGNQGLLVVYRRG